MVSNVLDDARAARMNWAAGDLDTATTVDVIEQAVALDQALRALIAEHERLTAPPTDTQVRVALFAYYSRNGAWVSEKDHWINEFVPNMRAALEAARKA